MESLWTMCYCLDFGDGTGVPTGWPPRQRVMVDQGREKQAGCVLSQVTPDSHPSCYFVLLSKPNLILPVSHLSTDLTNEMPSALWLACLRSDLELRRGEHNVLFAGVRAGEADASTVFLSFTPQLPPELLNPSATSPSFPFQFHPVSPRPRH